MTQPINHENSLPIEKSGEQPSALHKLGAHSLTQFKLGFMIGEEISFVIGEREKTIPAEEYLDICGVHAVTPLVGLLTEMKNFGPDRFPDGHENYTRALTNGQNMLTKYMGKDIVRVRDSHPELKS